MRAQWDACAAGWDAHTADIRAWLRMPTDAMIAMAGVAHGACVLDVAAGAGDQTLALAQQVGPTGRVLDYSDRGDEDRKLCSLYLGIMDRMGVKLDHFGDADHRLSDTSGAGRRSFT